MYCEMVREVCRVENAPGRRRGGKLQVSVDGSRDIAVIGRTPNHVFAQQCMATVVLRDAVFSNVPGPMVEPAPSRVT